MKKEKKTPLEHLFLDADAEALAQELVKSPCWYRGKKNQVLWDTTYGNLYHACTLCNINSTYRADEFFWNVKKRAKEIIKEKNLSQARNFEILCHYYNQE